jgi:hypothetical protein
VVEVENVWLGCAKHGKIEKVTGSQDDDFVGGSKKNTPNTLVERESRAKFSGPCGTDFAVDGSHADPEATLKPP